MEFYLTLTSLSSNMFICMYFVIVVVVTSIAATSTRSIFLGGQIVFHSLWDTEFVATVNVLSDVYILGFLYFLFFSFFFC